MKKLRRDPVDRVVESVVEQFPRQVAWIRWNRGEDHSGARCLFFRVVLKTLSVATGDTLLRVTEKIRSTLNSRLEYYPCDPTLSWPSTPLFYTNYRTETEMEGMKDQDSTDNWEEV